MPYTKGNTPRELIPDMTGTRAVQSLSVDVEKLLPHIRPGVAPSNGRGLHDASVADTQWLSSWPPKETCPAGSTASTPDAGHPT